MSGIFRRGESSRSLVSGVFMDSARYKVEDGRKEELCDQIFRLFRYYAPEIRRERIRMDNPDIDVDAISRRFDVTPDLEYMINAPEWDNEITRFSIRLRKAFEEEG